MQQSCSSRRFAWVKLVLISIISRASLVVEAFSTQRLSRSRLSNLSLLKYSPSSSDELDRGRSERTEEHSSLRWSIPVGEKCSDSRRQVLGNFFLAAALTIGSSAKADEWGVETEAPTVISGEAVMICKKRGPLGACLKEELRTPENDKDKANKYFEKTYGSDRPIDGKLTKQQEAVAELERESEGNALIQKLRQQSYENREENELRVRIKTLENNESASFGPFDRQVVILNADGKSFSLLQNPQAMRLKEKGFIKDRKFIKQPTPEELNAALEIPEDKSLFSGISQGLFGVGEKGEIENLVEE